MRLTRRGFIKLVWSGFLAGAAVLGYASAGEAMGRPRITSYKLKPDGWPDGLTLKIVALADFHACEPWMSAQRISSICEQANQLDADICLLLGDYARGMNFITEEVHSSSWSKSLAQLKAPMGVHAVLGNHDCWEDLNFQKDPSQTTISQKALQDAGIAVYVNDAIRLHKDGKAFWLAGLGDQMALRPGSRFGRAKMKGVDDLQAILMKIDDDAPIILMAHEPDIFVGMPDRVNLTLSGHTHGGQISIFGWKPFAASIYSRRYPAGHYRDGKRELVVSRGLGCTALPIRFGAWPEILHIEIG